MTASPEWPEADLATLRRLWVVEKKTSGQIAEIMGRTKNAIVGKVHRLNLDARPSPIRNRGVLDGYIADTAFVARFTEAWTSDMTRDAVAAKVGLDRERAYALAKKLNLPMPTQRGAPTVTLPPLRSWRRLPPPNVDRPAGEARQRLALTASIARIAPPVERRPVGKRGECQWPIGEPGRAGFRFCCTESVPGKPYCPDHARVAFVKVVDRREVA